VRRWLLKTQREITDRREHAQAPEREGERHVSAA
jgi:hypothetical protein